MGIVRLALVTCVLNEIDFLKSIEYLQNDDGFLTLNSTALTAYCDAKLSGYTSLSTHQHRLISHCVLFLYLFMYISAHQTVEMILLPIIRYMYNHIWLLLNHAKHL